MKRTYKKVHTNPSAAEDHIKKIRARGGMVKKTVSKGKITVTAAYPVSKPKYGQKKMKF